MKKIDISGSPFEIGLRLGELGREAALLNKSDFG